MRASTKELRFGLAHNYAESGLGPPSLLNSRSTVPYPITAELGFTDFPNRSPLIWESHCGTETSGSWICLAKDVGEDVGVEGPLEDEELEEEDGHRLDDVIELKDGVRELDKEGEPIELAGLAERCARLSFRGVCLGRRATLWRAGPSPCTRGTMEISGENGLGDRKGCRRASGAGTVGRRSRERDVVKGEARGRMKAGWGAEGVVV